MTNTPQAVLAPLSPAAIFLTIKVNETAPVAELRDFLASIPDITKDVAIRDVTGSVSCVTGIGADIWDKATGLPKPAQLHPFKELSGYGPVAVSTPGDLFFHIRAGRQDLCFELETRIMDELGKLGKVADETVGFRYFDARDLLGFVDGTANPVGADAADSALVGAEDDRYQGGSYVLVQKYLHKIPQWREVSTEEQEDIIGRTKLENVELDDAEGDAQKSHKTLNTIEDEEGNEHDILRDNMPFGSPGSGEFGTYFIGYAGDLSITEQMLERMFLGDPRGKYDRILDFSVAITGGVFFVPPLNVLESLSA